VSGTLQQQLHSVSSALYQQLHSLSNTLCQQLRRLFNSSTFFPIPARAPESIQIPSTNSFSMYPIPYGNSSTVHPMFHSLSNTQMYHDVS
jgi:hypothetical protein